MVAQPSGTQPQEKKYDNNVKGWYLRFDDINKMGYKYIFSKTYTWMGQFNIYNPTYCNENKEGNRDN